MTKLKEKECKRCKKVQSIELFVNLAGEYTSRGKYCVDCYIKLEIYGLKERLNEEIKRAILLYDYCGGEWDKHCLPCWMREHLLNERDICIYCGEKFKLDESGNLCINRDHMDPIMYGGEDSIRNVVYVCTKCNIRKGDMLFAEWLKKLKPGNKDRAHKIYIQRHGYRPEQYVAGEKTHGAIYGETEILFLGDMLEDFALMDLRKDPVDTIKDRKTLEYFKKLSKEILGKKVKTIKEKFRPYFLVHG